KNPLVLFTGLVLASLVALVLVITQRSEKVVAPEEAPPAKVATSEPPSGAQKPPEKPVGKSGADTAPLAEKPAPEPLQAPEGKIADQGTQAAGTAKKPEPAKPEFDTVRIEADGNAIVAGEAEPGAQVTLKLDGNIIGKGIANEEGAWLVVPDQPLPKGSHEIVAEQKVGAGGAPIMSDQSVTIALSEDGKKEPMIALLEPGQATKVIQKGEAKPSGLAEAPKPAEA